MAKRIKLTPDVIEEARAAFEKRIATAKSPDGKFTFQYDMASVERTATVYFEEKAWIKMDMLVQKVASEIGWHGIATRTDDPDEDGYVIHDILVYPQKVTGSTVDTDQDKLREWMNEIGGEVFQNVRFQGHSHVDFGASPSPTDNELYATFLAQLPKDSFYVFMILNKKGDRWIEVYDLAKNIHFEAKDIEAKVLEEDINPLTFMRDAVSKLSKPTYTAPKTNTYGNYSGYSGYGYGGYGYGGYSGGTKYPPYTPPQSGKKDPPDKEQKKENKKEQKGYPKKFKDSFYEDDYDYFDRY